MHFNWRSPSIRQELHILAVAMSAWACDGKQLCSSSPFIWTIFSWFCFVLMFVSLLPLTVSIHSLQNSGSSSSNSRRLCLHFIFFLFFFFLPLRCPFLSFSSVSSSSATKHLYTLEQPLLLCCSWDLCFVVCVSSLPLTLSPMCSSSLVSLYPLCKCRYVPMTLFSGSSLNALLLQSLWSGRLWWDQGWDEMKWEKRCQTAAAAVAASEFASGHDALPGSFEWHSFLAG